MYSSILTGLLWVSLKDIGNSTIDNLKRAYNYQNPHEPSKSFSTYIELKDRIGIPFGNQIKAHQFINKDSIKDQRVSPKADKPIVFTGPPLRDYQETASTETMQYIKEGGSTWNLAGKPGSGKTFMLAHLLSTMQVKTLVIAHLSMLTDQIFNELNDNLDADIRTLSATQLELGDINIATSQFISKRPELWKKIKHNIGFIVVDESESAASDTTLKILQRAHAKYRMFISATFTRSVDGRTEALIDLAGHKSIVLERKDLLEPTIIGVECPEYFRAPQHKHLFKRAQVDFYKNHLSIDDKVSLITIASLKKNRQVLIVTDLIDLQERYKSILEANGITVGILNGATKVKDRRQILEDYDKEDIKVLIGAAVLNAGLSIPKISVIIRVSFANSKEKLTQLIGRSLRDYEGKEGAWFIDLQFTQGVYKREQLYRAANFKYFKTTWNKFKESL